MPTHFIILYVASPLQSAAFYEKLLGIPVADASEGFAMLPLAAGVMLGLWRRPDVLPLADGQPGSSEIDVVQPDRASVERMAKLWQERGATLLQSPEVMDFGYTATFADPDGHRLRLFCPEG